MPVISRHTVGIDVPYSARWLLRLYMLHEYSYLLQYHVIVFYSCCYIVTALYCDMT